MDCLLFFVGLFVTTLEATFIENHRYLGCYIDTANRAIPDHVWREQVTITKCISHCKFHESRFAAMQNGQTCWCGSDGVSYDVYGQSPESDCYMPCTGDASQICGGPYRNSVFDLWEVYLADKTVTQSSVSSGGVPERAVDGNDNTLYPSGSCTHTDGGDVNPAWWNVDLGEYMCIQKVVIINRSECCHERLVDSIVQVGTYPDTSLHKQCGSPITSTQAGPGATVTVQCGTPICGKYVSVTSGFGINPGTLTMCEVYVFTGVCVDACPGSVGYTRIDGDQCIGTVDTTIDIRTVRSKIDCSRHCLNDDRCRSFDFVQGNGSTGGVCRLQTSKTTAELLDEDGCDFYIESLLI
ncbi:uncharacterized protein [Amphiura filiformis]|uniref:uncharacterized protein n=1 Tax=Amphiura filiformis TaxID=82378 RepID=UPI003B224D9F